MLQGKLTTGGTLSGTLSGSIKEPTLTTKNITENGTYNASSDNVDGYSQVNVDVEPELMTKNITENGTYNASSDNVDGYSQVNVDVEPTLTTKNITQNGTYNASSDNVDGYSQVNVDVASSTAVEYITYNGTATSMTTTSKSTLLDFELTAGKYIIVTNIFTSTSSTITYRIMLSDSNDYDFDLLSRYLYIFTRGTSQAPYIRIYEFSETKHLYLLAKQMNGSASSLTAGVNILKFT